MPFDPNDYGPEIAAILALADGGERLIPLVASKPVQAGAAALAGHKADELFGESRHPQGALAGLWTYFSCFEQAHSVAQEDPSSEGSYWHAILHRQEPDDFNSGYWIRRIGRPHPIEKRLAQAVAEIAGRHEGCGFAGLDPAGTSWDPHAFIEYCAKARRNPGSLAERFALEVQRAEWQILFDYCARRASSKSVNPA